MLMCARYGRDLNPRHARPAAVHPSPAPVSDRPKEPPVRRVILVELEFVPETDEKLLEPPAIGRRHLERREHPPEIGAVVPVMKQADVPAAAELVQELHQ